jgi:hypothetical protein
MFALAHSEKFSTDAVAQPSQVPPTVVARAVRVPLRKIRKRLELVNVTIARNDYEKLKVFGGCNRDYIEMALNCYLHSMKNKPLPSGATKWGWNRGPVVSFLCTLPKDLLDDVRNLPGRLDDHTMQAVQLLFLDDASRSRDHVPKSHWNDALSRGLLFATYAGIAFFVSRILRLVENLPLLNR